jgi:hypothetical protein
MAELTNLETKLGEVWGLALAAQDAGSTVAKLVDDRELKQALKQMEQEARETKDRCAQLAGTFTGKKTAIQDEAKSVREKGGRMMSTYLDEEADGLDGFEFLTMAEAGEVGHWQVLKALNSRARHAGVRELVAWALPIQQRHFKTVQQGSLKLAAEEDPEATA